MMLEHEQTGGIIVIRAWKMLQKLYFYIQYKTHFSNNPHEYIATWNSVRLLYKLNLF